jgi:cytochrome P450 family 142 subfamily A polypeptide 1
MVDTGAPEASVAPARLEVDLLDPAFYRDDPHPAFTWMRANEPLYRDGANGLWAVTTNADVHEVERRSATFVSGRGYRSWWSPEENNIIAQDDPAHLEQRRLVSDRFTPRGVRAHTDWLRSTISGLLDAVEARDGAIDVVDDLAAQLPSRLTARLLGLPEDRWPDVKSWSERLMRIDAAPADAAAAMGMFTAIGEFASLLGEVLPAKQGCPLHEAPDLLSVWANAEVAGRVGYTEDRLVNETGLFIAGGAETTRTVIAHGLDTFSRHPEQWDLLAGRPELVPSAVEELLRWVTPLNNFFRTAVEDTTIGGRPVAAGDRIILLYPSANRDEAVFDDPFRFDVTRSPNPHVAFGYGTHFCIGANLARHELCLLLAEMTARFEAPVVLEGPDVEANIFARSVQSMRAVLAPRDRAGAPR